MITPPRPTLLDAIAREAHIRRILHLQNAYRLGWLVDQATFENVSLSCLDDSSIIALHRDMERARECISDGVSFDDAGLVRDLSRASERVHPRNSAAENQAEIAAMGVERLIRRLAPEAQAAEFDQSPF